VLEQKLLAANGLWTPLGGAAAGPAGSILPAPSRDWLTGAWTAALADDTAAHLNDGPRAFYTRLHEQIARAAQLNESEYEEVGRLNVLSKPLTLSPDRVVDLVGQIEAERARNRAFALVASEALQTWQQAGRDPAEMLKAVRASSPAVKACTGTGGEVQEGLPRGRAPLSLPKPR
jgi:hypothetical protein